MARNLRQSPGFARELASYGLQKDGLGHAEKRHLFSITGFEGPEVDLGRVTYRRKTLTDTSSTLLAQSRDCVAPSGSSRLGMYDGATTLLLARNAPDAEVLTLDLPPTEASAATEVTEQDHAREGAVGRRFRGLPEEQRIKQLFGDSRAFDFSPWHGAMDLVLVDAGHEYQAVRADTENALKLVAPGGVVVWDDYSPVWPDVVRAVDQARLETFARPTTYFVVYEAPA